MRVTSFIRQGTSLRSVEVELTLVPGLPHITVLGLPDAALRESVTRVRAALRAQKFRFGRTQGVLVQLSPSHIKKSSQGLDLALAAAYLWETRQIPRPSEPAVLYGELTLSGQILMPEDAGEIRSPRPIYAARSDVIMPFDHHVVGELRDLARALPFVQAPPPPVNQIVRPAPNAEFFATEAAELAILIAAGEHSALIAGAPGSGKSTLAASIPAWVEPPSRATSANSWRPIVKPHHSISPMAMIGGGSKTWAGEIHRAHGGVLVMDEFLEFRPEIQELLREPLETGAITIARAGQTETFASRFLLVATANLCACGCYVPLAHEDICRCSSRERRRFLKRVSGPFADRFQMMGFSNSWPSSKGRVGSDEIIERVERATRFRVEQRAQKEVNSRTPVAPIDASLTAAQRSSFMRDLVTGSHRRREAALRVARTCADLRESLPISDQDLERALKLSVEGHRGLEAGV